MTGASVTRAKSEAVAETLATHAQAFRRFVRSRLPDAEVDDALQVAAVQAVERAGSLKQPDRVLGWLYRIHRNVITDVLRKRASHQRMLANEASAAFPVTSVDAEQCDCSLVQAQRLAPAYAEVLSLVDIGEASLSQAAEALGISANNAAVRLHRARKALRANLLEHCGVASARDCVACRCVLDGCCVA